MYPYLSGLDLADDPVDDQRLPVDILIGSHHYWDLTTGRIRRAVSGPVAIQTRLG